LQFITILKHIFVFAKIARHISLSN